MNRLSLLDTVGRIDTDLIEESLELFDADVLPPVTKTPNAFIRFMNSGWGVAVICAFVGVGVLSGIIWAGQHAPDEPTVPIGGTEKNSDEVVVTEPYVTDVETLTEHPTEAPTELPTENPTEPATEGVLYEPITRDGLTFVSNGDGTCTVNAADRTLTGAVSVPEVSPYGDRVTTIAAYGFSTCTAMTSITLPDSVTVIKSGAFRGCNKLLSIRMPQVLTSMGTAVFQECMGLTSITMPKGIETLPRQTFETCTELQSVEFQDGLTKISDRAFNGCSNLKILHIPATLTSVGNSAFLNCCGLRTVYFRGTREQWEEINVHKIGNSRFSGTPVTILG